MKGDKMTKVINSIRVPLPDERNVTDIKDAAQDRRFRSASAFVRWLLQAYMRAHGKGVNLSMEWGKPDIDRDPLLYAGPATLYQEGSAFTVTLDGNPSEWPQAGGQDVRVIVIKEAK